MITIDREHDPLAAAFDRFTAEASDDIVAPGAVRARHTVTRRRRRNAVVALAVVVAGSAVVATAGPGHRSAGPIGVGTPETRVVPDDAILESVAALDGGADAQSTGTGPDRAEVADLPDGTYELTYDCVGPGTVNVTISFTPANGGDSESTTAGAQRCAAVTIPARVPLYHLGIHVQGPGQVNIDWGADSEAMQHSAMAYRLDWVGGNGCGNLNRRCAADAPIGAR